MSSLLLTTKLHIPQVRTECVSRPCLVARLQKGLAHKLILISAPAGYGKTTLACEWLASCGQLSAWLSLDNEDNDPTRFNVSQNVIIMILIILMNVLSNPILGGSMA